MNISDIPFILMFIAVLTLVALAYQASKKA